MTRRTERVNELLREEISEILRRELKDPRLQVLASVTEVQVSPDLKSARVYLSVMADDAERDSAFQALKAATAFIRRELRQRLPSLRFTPELTFVPDLSIERGARLSALIDEVAAGGSRNGA
jgi:ribosome-binding factor A